jgi:hypothetical protein
MHMVLLVLVLKEHHQIILIDVHNINMDMCGEKCLENIDPPTENVQRRKQLGLNKM